MIDRGFYRSVPARNRHCEKAFSADEAIFIARITSIIDCFVVPPYNDAYVNN